MNSTNTLHVAWSNQPNDRPGTLLVLALHGRGSDEQSMVGLAQHLPLGATVAAMRAPIAEGPGFAWFANRGIGRPTEESIKGSVALIEYWLDSVAQEYSGVVLLGFSGGTAMAGALLLSDPSRYAGGVLLSGTLPWDAGFNSDAQRFSGLPVFWANDPADAVIPQELVQRSEAWLQESSGARLIERHYSALGHGINSQELAEVSSFIDSIASTLLAEEAQ